MLTLFDNLKLLGGLLTRRRAFTGPFFVSVDLTRRCNLKCLYCRYHSPEASFPSPLQTPLMDMPLDVISQLMQRFGRESGERQITFEGEGDPLLHPQFLEAVALVKDAGQSLNVITNGTLFSEQKVRALLDLRVDAVTVSMWASSPEEYEKLYPGSPGRLHQKALDGLRLVDRLKRERGSATPLLRIHRPITRENCKTIEQGAEQACEVGCNRFTLTPVMPHNGDTASCVVEASEMGALRASLGRLRQLLARRSVSHNIDDALLLYTVGESVWKTMPCYMGWLHTRVKLDGTVYPCARCDSSMGNLRETDFDAIWNGAAYQDFREQSSSRKGLKALNEKSCACDYCCLIVSNHKVHRVFKVFGRS